MIARSLSAHLLRHLVRLTSAALLATGLGAAALLAGSTAPAGAAEACPNEALRVQSNVNPATGQPYSTQLPDCRAYELVSPPDTGGIPAVSVDYGVGAVVTNGAEFDQVTPGGALFWVSRAIPAGTGAVPNGSSVGVFVSRRAAGGWTTRDLTPFSTNGNNELFAGAPDGSAALILTQTDLLPEDQDNPFNGQGGKASSRDIYRVSEGEAPLLVSHGSAPRTVPPNEQGLVFEGARPIAFNAPLTAVAFVSTARLTGIEEITEEEASLGFKDCYAWSDVRARLAGLTNPDIGSTGVTPRNCELLGMTPDGRPIFKDLSGDSYNGLIFVGNGVRFPLGKVTPVQLSAPTSTATTFEAVSPDGSLAYVTTAYPLGNEERGGEPNVYAVTVPAFPQHTLGTPGETGQENTVVCLSCQLGGGGAATFAGQSADGSHVFFNVGESAGESAGHPYKGLWSWDRDSGTASRLTVATDVEQLISSQNGQYAAGLTRQLVQNPNGTADVYELSASLTQPRLITSGVSADTYRLAAAFNSSPPTVAGVSNDGQRVVYDDTPPGSGAVLETLQEWTHGETVQLSPLGATSSYYVLGTAGPELEDVFFLAQEPLVPADRNGGTQDVYDARIGGGFPYTPPTSCDPLAGACQGPPTPPPAPGQSPGGATFSGPGNPAPVHPKKKCEKGFVRKHGKCVKKPRHTRPASHNRRAHR